MLPRNRLPTVPGEVLVEEFLGPLGLAQVELVRRMSIRLQRVNTGNHPFSAIISG